MSSRAIFIRHAKPLSSGFADDSERPLSNEGKATQRLSAQKLKELGVSPKHILTSPLLRAIETAEIIAEELGGCPIVKESALGEDFNADELLKKIPGPSSEETLIFVGHAPTLAAFIHQLVGKAVLQGGLSKSAAVIVDFEEEPAFGSGLFIQHIPPQ